MNSNLKFFLGGVLVGGLAGALVCYLQHRNHQLEVKQLQSDIDYLGRSRRDKTELICELEQELDEVKAELIETQAAIGTFTDDLEGDIPGCIKDLVDARMTTWRGHRDGKSEEDITTAILNLRLVNRSDGETVVVNDEEVKAMSDLAEDLGYNRDSPWNVKDITARSTGSIGQGGTQKVTFIDEGAQDDEDDSSDPAINGDLKCEEISRYSDETHPYLISEQDFIGSQYDQVSFTYYAADDTLMEDRDQEPIDQDNLGVTDLLLEFARTDGPAIYVRDDTKMLDYEIIWEDGSFQAIVMGMNPESLLLLPRIFREG